MVKSTIKLIGLFSKKISDEHVAAFSAQAAFFIIISFFPFIMLLLSIIRYIPFEESTMLEVFSQIFPSAINSLVVTVIDEIYHIPSTGTLIPITAITALWSASKGFLAIMRGLNSVYEINESRNYFFLRITSTIYTLVFAIMLIASMVLFVFGNSLYLWIEQKIPAFQGMALLIISLRTIVGMIILLIFFLIIYLAIPNRKTKIINCLPGAILCSAGWMGFSYAFSYYIDHSSNYSSTYGSLTTIVLFMLWLYFCMYILFIGAEVNHVFEDKAIVKEIKDLYS
ncbi:MAG TPA: YihY/virulence factor BrkB family protein [Mobilitalea sp.]|nr:YihY/virulence factor BrkB family protein [Mobilitalea sp.]